MWQDKHWLVQEIGESEAAPLAQALGVPVPIAKMLLRRNVTEVQQARFFLGLEEEPFHDPFLLNGMTAAVERIVAAVQQGEPIAIYGDYDVDGITATAVLMRFFTQRGADVRYYIPERQSEGYGLNVAALQKLAVQGVKLVITVDCGISGFEEVAGVPELDMVITDHHQPPERLPAAAAVVNPKVLPSAYPFAHLAGAGVALKLCQALAARFCVAAEEWDALYELAMLGTVADMVSLTGENRLLVRKGLASVNSRPRILGLQALLAVSNNKGRQVDTGIVGFALAPRLNAAGRLACAESAVQLLLTDDECLAQSLAEQLNQENYERQQIEKGIFQDAEAMIQAQGGPRGVLVLASENWHAGVIGIVASRLVERYYVPVVLISLSGEVGKGSCRSIEAFDLYQGLAACAEHLIQFGGHHQAAGLTVARHAIDAFRRALEAVAAARLTKADYRQPLRLDGSLALGMLTEDVMQWLVRLEPFGMGNPRPVFSFWQVQIRDVQSMGEDNSHLRLQLADGTGEQRAVMWRAGHYRPALWPGLAVDVAAVAEYNHWRGKATIQLRLVDIRQVQWVFDYRQALSKETCLKNILQIDKKTIVYGMNENHNPSERVRCLPYYQPVPPECELLVLAGLPPCDAEQAAWLRTLPDTGCHLALLFNVADRETWRRQEAQSELSREKLALLYRAIKESGATAHLAELCEATCLPPAQVSTALTVFTELELIAWESKDQVRLVPQPDGQKKAIESSPTFAALRERAATCRRQIDALFQRPASAWLSRTEN